MPETELPIFLSHTYPHRADQRAFVTAVADAVTAEGMAPKRLSRDRWSFELPLMPIQELMRDCCGTLVLAMVRSRVEGVDYVDSDQAERFSSRFLETEWTHIETALAFQLEHPILAFREDRIEPRGLLDPAASGLEVHSFSLEPPIDDAIDEIRRRLPGFREQVAGYHADRRNTAPLL